MENTLKNSYYSIPPNSEDLIAINSLLPNISIHPKAEDTLLWSLQPQDLYSSASAYEVLRSLAAKVDWCTIVWYKDNIYMLSFMQWFTCKNRLCTETDLKPLRGIARDVIGAEEGGDDCGDLGAVLQQPVSLQDAGRRSRARRILLGSLNDYRDLGEIRQCERVNRRLLRVEVSRDRRVELRASDKGYESDRWPP
ncbi:hypothetical protein RJ640_027763 [Escallonia rubra]|uniref:Reverse transcriptase zinc-binding domain-containing protein n=1 Tax=Escallonia rubra TaxID=112253 RepID=A0AA88R8E8_9ASTE|nr:hypothetical protein RJ640_027763 [Escallonia rubra]